MMLLKNPFLGLMKRLRFANKFLLVTACFALPMFFTSASLLIELWQRIEAIQQQQNAALQMVEMSNIAQEMENLRDLKLLEFLLLDSGYLSKVKAQRNIINTRLNAFSDHFNLTPFQSTLLASLKQETGEDTVSPGMEAIPMKLAFENAHRSLEALYELQSSVLVQSGLLSGQRQDIFGIVNLANEELQAITKRIAEVRISGAFYLRVGYVDASGVELLDQQYRDLEQTISALRSVLANLSVTYPEFSDLLVVEHFIEPLLLVKNALDTDLMQAMTLTQKSTEFEVFQKNNIDAVYELQRHLFERVLAHLQQVLENQLIYFGGVIAGLTLLLCVFMLMFLAFYRSVNSALKSLRLFASEVAQGQYETSVDLNTQDELNELAVAMEQMRSQLKAREDKLYALSTTDALTGVYNRQYFDQAVSKEIERARRQATTVALLFLDADHFKQINDTLGHLAGDAVLSELGNVLKGSIYRATDMVARYGGEEFAILLPNTNLKGAVTFAERIRETIEKHSILFEDEIITITVSIGVAAIRPDRDTLVRDLVAQADEAVYQAKMTGRNRCCTLTQTSTTLEVKESAP
ncbi:MAG: diguanylate cyclase [Pseudomonadales bacterium]|nr:diguanylate cyclase [Pseudomonadales bacterium]